MWILGLILSVPISIISGYLKDGLDSYLAERNKQAAIELVKEVQSEYKKVKELHDDRGMFKEYLLWIGIRATMVGALIGILTAGVLVVLSVYRVTLEKKMGAKRQMLVSELSNITALSLSIVGGLLVYQICNDGLVVYEQVTNFSEYEAWVSSRLNELGKVKP